MRTRDEVYNMADHVEKTMRLLVKRKKISPTGYTMSMAVELCGQLRDMIREGKV